MPGGRGQSPSVDDAPDTNAEFAATGASAVRERRRFARFGEILPVPTLVDQSVRSTESQLLDAREALKDARRRVVQLESALESWRDLRDQMARTGSDPTRAAAN